MAKTSAKRKTINYKGDEYIGVLKCGKVRVFIERTARGQQILIGVYDPTTTTWCDKAMLPTFVKEEIECAFAK